LKLVEKGEEIRLRARDVMRERRKNVENEEAPRARHPDVRFLRGKKHDN